MTIDFPEPNLLRQRLPFRPLGGDQCVTSLELAREIGFADPRWLNRWITTNLDEFAKVGAPPTPIDLYVKVGDSRVRKSRSFWLNGGHVITIVMTCLTERTDQARADIICEITEMQKELGFNGFAFF